jgi:hypothetical protein
VTVTKAYPKGARRVTITPTVWVLMRLPLSKTAHFGNPEHVGVFSSEGKATSEAFNIIMREAGVPLRLPAFHLTPLGGKELSYGREGLSWHFTVDPWPVDGVAT